MPDQTEPDPQRVQPALVCVVLDEFPQILAQTQGSRPYSWCLQETAVTVSNPSSEINLAARPPPPAFLFPIYNVKDPIDFPSTPLFFADGRRRRLSIRRPPSCQSLV